MKIKGFYEPIFGYTVLVVVSPYRKARTTIRHRLSREKDILAVFDREYPEVTNASGCTFPMLPECLVIVWINSDEKDVDADTPSHEAFHVADGVLRYCGVVLENGSSEVFAHYVGWVTKCIQKTTRQKTA